MRRDDVDLRRNPLRGWCMLSGDDSTFLHRDLLVYRLDEVFRKEIKLLFRKRDKCAAR